MPLLRRTTEPVADPDEADVDTASRLDPAYTASKGRRTPKRSEARQSRRAPAPKSRKEADQLRKRRTREQRHTMRQALLTGDERNLPARDRGPARRLARDLVDARFTLGQFAIVLLLVLLLLSSTPNAVFGLISRLLLLVLTAAVFGQAYVIARAAQRRIVAEHGTDAGRGIIGYVLVRALTSRRLRRPPPKVQRGTSV